jgi:hypothetical protein
MYVWLASVVEQHLRQFDQLFWQWLAAGGSDPVTEHNMMQASSALGEALRTYEQQETSSAPVPPWVKKDGK